MEIFICGDPHGQFEHIIDAVLCHRPAAIILLGDNMFSRPAHEELASIVSLTDIWWIHGNHDCDEERYYDNLFASKIGDRNLHGRVVTIANVRIGGLGGVVRQKVWKSGLSPDQWVAAAGKGNLWRGGMSLRNRASIFPSEIEDMASQSADILVSHEAPDLHPYGFSGLTNLANRMGVTKAYHGHQHQDINNYENGVWIGIGERGIQAWPSGSIIRPGETQDLKTNSD